MRSENGCVSAYALGRQLSGHTGTRASHMAIREPATTCRDTRRMMWIVRINAARNVTSTLACLLITRRRLPCDSRVNRACSPRAAMDRCDWDAIVHAAAAVDGGQDNVEALRSCCAGDVRVHRAATPCGW